MPALNYILQRKKSARQPDFLQQLDGALEGLVSLANNSTLPLSHRHQHRSSRRKIKFQVLINWQCSLARNRCAQNATTTTRYARVLGLEQPPSSVHSLPEQKYSATTRAPAPAPAAKSGEAQVLLAWVRGCLA
ncbi:hypothetical protein Mapa_006414 [Marchantia paleacea]|nr:hypothetical protein Mapa_006414 [Marchantia paleacea]